MKLTDLFIHGEVAGRDRVQYGGVWTAEQKATIEAAFDVLVDDPAFPFSHGKPRVPKRVHGSFNHFICMNWGTGKPFGIKRFTWERWRHFDTLDGVVECIKQLYGPLLEQE